MTSRQRRGKALAALGIVAFLVCFALLPLPRPGLPLLPVCPFKSMTGLPCPLCGGTRAAHAMLQGDLARTLYLNPLAIPAVLLLVFAALVLAYESSTGTPLANWTIVSRRLNALFPFALAALLIWWLPHIYLALRTPKPELLELSNPIAHAVYERLGTPTASVMN
ncbi:hypothetical protein BH09VER1_BH09VER1_45160 [soil metagenome]